MNTTKKEKKIVPLLLYRKDIENVEFLLKKYGEGTSQAALTRMLYAKEADRIRQGGAVFVQEENGAGQVI